MRIILIGVLLLAVTGCESAKLWMVGYDEQRAKNNCVASTPTGTRELESTILRRARDLRTDKFIKAYERLSAKMSLGQVTEAQRAERNQVIQEMEADTVERALEDERLASAPPKWIVTPYPAEQVQQAIDRCVRRSRNTALTTSVPVVFTVPLVQ